MNVPCSNYIITITLRNKGVVYIWFQDKSTKGKFHTLGNIGGGYLVLPFSGLKYELNYIVHPLFHQISYVFISSLDWFPHTNSIYETMFQYTLGISHVLCNYPILCL